jgi:hypothetical protein
MSRAIIDADNEMKIGIVGVKGAIAAVADGYTNTAARTTVRVRGAQPPTARIGAIEFMWQPCLSIVKKHYQSDLTLLFVYQKFKQSNNR